MDRIILPEDIKIEAEGMTVPYCNISKRIKKQKQSKISKQKYFDSVSQYLAVRSDLTTEELKKWTW